MATGIQEKISLLVEWGVSLGITVCLVLGVINRWLVVMDA